MTKEQSTQYIRVCKYRYVTLVVCVYIMGCFVN